MAGRRGRGQGVSFYLLGAGWMRLTWKGSKEESVKSFSKADGVMLVGLVPDPLLCPARREQFTRKVLKSMQSFP